MIWLIGLIIELLVFFATFFIFGWAAAMVVSAIVNSVVVLVAANS